MEQIADTSMKRPYRVSFVAWQSLSYNVTRTIHADSPGEARAIVATAIADGDISVDSGWDWETRECSDSGVCEDTVEVRPIPEHDEPRRCDDCANEPSRDDDEELAKLRGVKMIGLAYHKVTGNQVVALLDEEQYSGDGIEPFLELCHEGHIRPVVGWTFVQLDSTGTILTDSNDDLVEVDVDDIDIRPAPPITVSTVTAADDDDDDDDIRRYFAGVLPD